MSSSVDQAYKSYFQCLSTIFSSETSMINPQDDDRRVNLCNKLLQTHLQTLPSLPEDLKFDT